MTDLAAQATFGRAHKRYGAVSALVAGWAAFGITLSGATQLRVAGPLGPSEGILAVWILFVTFLLLRGVPVTAGRVFLGLLAYWLVALTLLSFGALVAVQSHNFIQSDAIHDGLAFIYVAVLTCLLSLGLPDEDGREYHLQLARMAFLFSSIAAALLLCVGIANIGLGPIRLWYAGVRFSGWAENPNQMALAVVAMPFLGWYLLNRASSLARKAAYLLGIGFCVAAGLATQSDALRLAWVVSMATVGGLLWYRAVVRGRARWLYVSHLIVPALVVVGGLFFGGEIAGYLQEVVASRYEEQEQGSTRTTLWAHGLQAIAQSPLVGFGPGPHSGLGGPFQGAEAHNSLIDWGMSSGLIGILLHVSLWGWCAWRAMKSDSIVLLGMMTSLIIFSQIHYGMRHPTYWLILVLVLTLTERRVGPRAQQATWLTFPPASTPLQPGPRGHAPP